MLLLFCNSLFEMLCDVQGTASSETKLCKVAHQDFTAEEEFFNIV